MGGTYFSKIVGRVEGHWPINKPEQPSCNSLLGGGGVRRAFKCHEEWGRSWLLNVA